MHTTRVVLVCLLALAATACGKTRAELVIPNPGEPAFAPAHFDATSASVTNPFCPVVDGRTLNYVAQDSDETSLVESTGVVRTISGVRCAEVRECTYASGELVEETLMWLAQDTTGNVWVLGESQREYMAGAVVNTDGSWDAEADGVAPSIRMKAAHVAGDTYRQSSALGESPDWVRITAADLEISLPGTGVTYAGCVRIQEWDPAEFGSDEFKYFAPGLGLVFEHDLDGGDPIELVGVTSR